VVIDVAGLCVPLELSTSRDDVDGVQAQRYYVQKRVFEKIAKHEGRIPHHCGHTSFVQAAADTGTYYEYYRQNHDIFQRRKQSTRPSIKLLAINILSYFVIKT